MGSLEMFFAGVNHPHVDFARRLMWSCRNTANRQRLSLQGLRVIERVLDPLFSLATSEDLSDTEAHFEAVYRAIRERRWSTHVEELHVLHDFDRLRDWIMCEVYDACEELPPHRRPDRATLKFWIYSAELIACAFFPPASLDYLNVVFNQAS